MITVPTALVLGAGASKPYGLPTGVELRQEICHQMRPDSKAVEAIRRLGHEDDEIEYFRDQFHRSRVASIDRFLANRAEFHAIGKAAIAAVLIQAEEPEHVLDEKWLGGRNDDDGAHDDWYGYLWNTMEQSWAGFGGNALFVITFNYDRSLEFFLATALANLHGKRFEEALNKVYSTLQIVHVYGTIGKLGTHNGKETRAYRTELSEAAMRAAVSSLRVIPEYRDHPENARAIQTFLTAAKRICYLGFSYDPINVERLKLDECLPRDKLSGTPAEHRHGKDVSGTVYGMLSEECVAAARRVKGDPARFRDLRCAEFLRWYGILQP